MPKKTPARAEIMSADELKAINAKLAQQTEAAKVNDRPSDEDVLAQFHAAAQRMLDHFGIVDWKRTLVNYVIATAVAAGGAVLCVTVFDSLAIAAFALTGWSFVVTALTIMGNLLATVTVIAAITNAEVVGEFVKSGGKVVAHRAKSWFGAAKSAVTSFEMPKFGFASNETVH